MQNHKELFYSNLVEYYSKNKEARKPWTHEEMKKISNEIIEAKLTVGSKTNRQYHLLSLYDIIDIKEKLMIIKKRLADDKNAVYITPYEDLFEVLYPIHISAGHGGRDKMMFALKTKHYIPRIVIETFIQSCAICHKKKNFRPVNLVNKSITSKEFSSRGQVGLIDYQSMQDGQYKWLLNYQEDLTKFICLRPLKSKTPAEVAKELLKIFLELGPPSILQNDNDREFVDGIIMELVKLWPDLKHIHEQPLDPQIQVSIEKSNQDVDNMLRAWMTENNSTNWSVGCYFIQFQKNCSFHRTIGRCPYKALFGTDPKIKLSSRVSNDTVTSLKTKKVSDETMSQLLNSCNVFPNNSNDFLEAEKQEISMYLKLKPNMKKNVEETKSDNYEINDIVTISGNETGVNKVQEAGLEVKCLNCETQNNISSVQCSEQQSILNIKHEYNLGQKRAAEEMIANTAKKLPDLKLGDCIILPVEEIDRGPSDIENIVCVITAFKNGVYQLGTAAGTIKGWFNRGDITAAEYQFLNVDAVPENNITIREAVASIPLCGISSAENFLKCSCKPAKKQCQTTRCVCFKKNMICGSRCHSLACLNT